MITKFSRIVFVLSLAFCFGGCEESIKDYTKLATYSNNGSLNAVIEIPAGTNKKIEYDKATLQFKVDQINGKDRVINYLPYLGNYGFIPSTLSDKVQGGDGDPLDILILSETLPTGTVIEVIPIAVLKIVDEGEEDDKIIAIPKDEKLRIINAVDYNSWISNYDNVHNMIITWYKNYDKTGTNTISGYRNENAAKQIITKWQL